MVVALSALHRRALENVKYRGDHFVAIKVLGNSTIEFVLSNFVMPDEVPGTGRQKT